MIRPADIADAIERIAPLDRQEEWDNSGWQVLPDPDAEVTGVLVCVDATPDVVREATAMGFNLIVSHHPILFRGQKSFTGATLVQQTVMDAIRNGIGIYASHTSLDNSPEGVSFELGKRLGLTDMAILSPMAKDPAFGLGVIGNLPEAMSLEGFAALVKSAYGSPIVRCSAASSDRRIKRVALCGGAGGEFIDLAVAGGADAYVNSDTRHHDFVDHGARLAIIDTGHHEAEQCAREILKRVISENFANFAVKSAQTDCNPIIYL